ncbi:MAG: InlB B-repeat-containing protein [Oscillospiraceae bacterium]|jgi:uncharacterized repeat protein (TIGR02543 family)|nr:InlB B-repeat-containing protein [Oscillospiraceae bacterium]
METMNPTRDFASTPSTLKKAFSALLALLLVAGVFFVVPLSVSAENTGDWSWYYVDKNGQMVWPDFGFDENNGLSETYDFSKVVGVAIDEYTGAATSVTTPATLGGYPVQVIGFGAFADNITIKSVKISEGVKTIEFFAFVDCVSLTSVTLPSSLRSIEASAFSNCAALKTVTLPKDISKISDPFGYEYGKYPTLVCYANSPVHKWIVAQNNKYDWDKNIPYRVYAETIKLPATKNIGVGKTATLTITVTPKDAIAQTLTWSSSNKAIATVDATGKIKGIKAGTVTITAETYSKKEVASCKVTVKAASTVKFDAQSGTKVANKSIAYDTAVGTLTTPKRTGYKFAGWYTAKTGGTKITSKTKVTKATTYYAHWTANKYAVTFNANGGSAVKAKSISYNTAVGALPTPTRKGYKLVGWYTKKSGGTKIAKTQKITKATTYYAHWAKK